MAASSSDGSFTAKRWAADEESEFCYNCSDKFSFYNRKHHCRGCGRLLCDACCSNWMLIPANQIVSAPNCPDDPSVPQRCCNSCYRTYQPLQTELRQNISRASSDTFVDRDDTNRYVNLPVSRQLQTDIRKATYTLYNFTSDNKIQGQDTIPRELIQKARGIAFITILKAGFLFTGRIGTGLVIARLPDNSWSAPSAIAITGMGWGFQIGSELTDVVLILTTDGAVDAFCSSAQVSLGTELGVSVGPVGRSAGTDLHAGTKGASAAFSYAHSKGLFFGISLEASVIAARPDVNRMFYGLEVSPRKLLKGEHPRPRAAEPLYQALNEVMVGMNFSEDHGQHYNGSDEIRWMDDGLEPTRNYDQPSQTAFRSSSATLISPSNDAWAADRRERLERSSQREKDI